MLCFNPYSWYKLVLVTTVLVLHGANGLNRCLDPEDSVNYKCSPGETSLSIGTGTGCGYLADADLPDLQACFNTAGRTGIASIDLRLMAVVKLPVGMFDNLPNLSELVLGSSVAETFQVGFFDNLKASRHVLRIEDSPELSWFPPNLFRKLSGLQILSLRGNPKLEALPVGVFLGNRKLVKLNLKDCGLTALPLGIFNGLLNLELLNLKKNSLTTLPANIFGPLVSLQVLWLHGDGMEGLQCLPESTARRTRLENDSAMTGTCGCDAVSSCPEGTTCSPGEAGYTCELPC